MIFLLNTFCQFFSQSTDLISTVGYDNIIQHLNNGRKNCKEFEDFLKERASIEERYGKELLNLSRKKPCGQTELKQVERTVIHLYDLSCFQRWIVSAKATSSWPRRCGKKQGKWRISGRNKSFIGKRNHRESDTCVHQKYAARSLWLISSVISPKHKIKSLMNFQTGRHIELVMDAIHKNRNLQYKKTLEAKRLYEQRCRDKDEAEQAVHRSANLVTPKQQEKLFVKLAQTKTALEDSDRVYQMNVGALEKIREEWQNEHVKACEFFENQECERINYFRNTLWVHVNQLSLECVKNDENYEEIRKSLEQCSVEKDIESPVVYENYYNSQKNAMPGKSQAPAAGRRPQLPVPASKPSELNWYLCVN
ncbi:hypothetical protein JD844_008198 [Phrynosoma platyrhinos]|uniref:F-BAR domain-containing protein n=1 Tax=Phrynosoma platyrhinos TaxID=52577 RepID=A0ABQ7TEE5_PHRPL|nr:hypothetical protein JD844_008198 [Phrynosoma platyrhinos]